MVMLTVCVNGILNHSQVFVTMRNVVAERLCFHRHLSFCSQGGMWQTPPPRQTPPPQADTPSQCRHPLGRYPSWQTSSWVDTPWADTPWADTPLGMATASDGTHPTGMHSCSFIAISSTMRE